MASNGSHDPKEGGGGAQETRPLGTDEPGDAHGVSATRRIEPATRVVGPQSPPPAAGTVQGLGPAPPGPPSVPADDMPFERGAMLDRYMVVDVLGRGGMGVVLRAFDPDLDRSVAIKVLLPSASGGDRAAARARLVREAQAMARLSHPNVVTVFDVGMVEGHVFVAMEHAASTLKEWLAAGGRRWQEVLDAYLEAGKGLAAAHGAGLVHRDFKPANVLVSQNGEIWVTDFGLVAAAPGSTSPSSAKVPSARSSLWPPTGAAERGCEQSDSDLGSGGSPLDVQLTRSGVVMGTPAYMAPEQHAGGIVDARADQFSFCVALYRGLYEQRPFSGRGIAQLRASVLQGKLEPPPPDSEVPTWIWEALRRGLATEADKRFPSMDELLEQLQRDPDREQAQHLTVEALMELGSVKADRGDIDASEAVLREALARAEQAGDLRREAEASLRLAVLIGLQADRHQDGLDMIPELSELIARAGEDLWQRARLHSLHGVLLRWSDDNLAARGHFDQAVALTEQTGRGGEYVMAAYQNNLGDALYWLDEEAEALAAHQRALTIAEERRGPNSVEAGNAHRGITLCKLSLEQFAEARHHCERALSIMEGDLDTDRFVILQLHEAHARIVHNLGLHEEAVALWRYFGSQLGETKVEQSSRGIADLRAGMLLLALGRASEAGVHLERARVICESLGDEERLTLVEVYDALAQWQREMGELERALESDGRAQKLRAAVLDPAHPGHGVSLNNKALSLIALGRLDEAQQQLDRALVLYRSLDPPAHDEIATTLANQARVLKMQQRLDEASAKYGEALATRRGAGRGHPLPTAGLLTDTADLHYERGDYEAALAYAADALEVLEQAGMADHPWVAIALTNMGNSLVALKRFAAAVPYLERALGLREGSDGDPGLRGGSRIGLAMALWHSTLDRPRAVELARQALQEFLEAGPAGEANVLQIRSWLAQCEGALRQVDDDGPNHG